MIGQAVREIEEARRAEAGARARNARLRHLVALVDASIEACEEAHLMRIKHPTPELAARGRSVAAEAAVVLDGDRATRAGAPERLSAAAARRITELMDDLWLVQEAALDALVPVRSSLPDEPDEPAPAPSQRAA